MRLLLVLFLCFGSVAVSAQMNGARRPAPTNSERERAAALLESGLADYNAGRFPEAAQKLEEAYGLVPSPNLAYNVGRVYERMSEYDAAVRYFRIYLRSDVEDAVRTDIQGRIEALQAAKRRARQQVFTAPPGDDELTQEARTFFRRGVTMYRRRRYEAALTAFTAALRFREIPEIYYNMAVAAERLDRFEEAMTYYESYIEGAPRAADRGHVERQIQRLRERMR
ncbi:MAG: tetratricopeptide repeat protein [Myxococcota bacterium]